MLLAIYLILISLIGYQAYQNIKLKEKYFMNKGEM